MMVIDQILSQSAFFNLPHGEKKAKPGIFRASKIMFLSWNKLNMLQIAGMCWTAVCLDQHVRGQKNFDCTTSAHCHAHVWKFLTPNPHPPPTDSNSFCEVLSNPPSETTTTKSVNGIAVHRQLGWIPWEGEAKTIGRTCWWWCVWMDCWVIFGERKPSLRVRELRHLNYWSANCVSAGGVFDWIIW